MIAVYMFLVGVLSVSVYRASEGRMRARTWLRRVLLLVALMAPSVAQAEADTFGTGDGHTLAAKTAAGDEVINVYAPLTADAAAGASTISVDIANAIGAAGGFADGDLVLVWRATGVADADAPSGSPSRIDLGVATGGIVGRWELARIAAGGVGATSLTLTKPLVK